MDTRAAWQALRASRRRLDRSRYRDIPGSMPAKQPCRTGCSPREAERRLAAAGVPEDPARRLVQQALRDHAESVVASWSQWIERHGFLDELAALPPDDRGEFEREHRWRTLVAQVGVLTTDPGQALRTPGLLADLNARASQLNRRDHTHPAAFVLQRVHGMPASLADAALLYSRAVPWWAFAALAAWFAACVLLCLVALLAVLGGQFSALPMFLAALVFGSFFGFSLVYLWRQRPIREQAWRDRLAAWRAESNGQAR